MKPITFLASLLIATSSLAAEGPDKSTPVERYHGHTSVSLFLCKVTQSAALVTGDTQKSVSCIKDAKAEAKQNFDKALRTLRKPKARDALKSYHVAYVTALEGMALGFEERKISYEQRQQALEDKLTEAWARFEVEQ